MLKKEILTISGGETVVIDHEKKVVYIGYFTGANWHLNNPGQKSGVEIINTAHYISGRTEGTAPQFGYSYSSGEGKISGRFATYYTFKGCNKNLTFRDKKTAGAVAVIHARKLKGYRAEAIPYLDDLINNL